MNSRLTLSGEVTALSKIALPLIAAYLAEYAMLQTTKIIVGHLGYLQLAAVGISNDITFEFLIVFMGLLSVIGVFVAQAEAVSDKKEAGNATRQGLLYATMLGLPLSVLVWNMDILLTAAGQSDEVIRLAIPYLQALSGSVLPVLWFNVLRSYVSALAQPHAMMVISLIAVGVNYFVTVALVHGSALTPAMGLRGAGLSVSIVSWLMLLALVAHIANKDQLRGYGLFRGRVRIDLRIWRDITWLGVPVAGLVFLEAGMFLSVSILSGIIGAKTLAASQILLGWVGLPFVVALGIAEATMFRVAYGTGANNLRVARQSGIVGMVYGSSFLSLMVIFPVFFPDRIVEVFIDPTQPGSDDVAVIATSLLAVVAVFQVFDGLQAIAARALRAMKDTMVPLLLAGFGYWVCGIGGGTVLAFVFDWQARGLWWGLAAGLIATGSLLAWRFIRLTRPQ